MMAMEHSDDLDQLLDSALDDFQSLNLASSAPSQDDGRNKACLPSGVQGLGMGLPDLTSKKKGKQQKESSHHVSETLNKLRDQTRETVRGMESIAAGPKPGGIDMFGGDDSMMEDWVKQFEELAGSQDMESMVETMMQQLLSREVLHEPIKEIGERYPKWLQDNKSKLSKQEYDRYLQQREFIKDLNAVYETEPDNFNKIVDLMHKMQECGQPPDDIVKDLAPDFDISSFGQLSPEMLDAQQNCCIM